MSSPSLDCAVCLDIFEDPRIIECGHSFCLKCLKMTPVRCPVCRYQSETPDSRLPVNYSLKGIIEDLRSSSVLSPAPPSCSLCSQPAQNHCKNCNLRMCAVHTAEHNKSPFMKNHQVASCKQERPKCAKHEEEMKLYCETCSKLICSVCFPLEHQSHRIIAIPEAAGKERKKISELVSTLREAEGEVEKSIKEVERKIVEDDEKIERLRREIRVIEEGKKEKEGSITKLRSTQNEIKVHIDTISRVSQGPVDTDLLLQPQRTEQIIGILKNRIPQYLKDRAVVDDSKSEWKKQDIDDHFSINGDSKFEWKKEDIDDHFSINGNTITHKHDGRSDGGYNHLLRSNTKYKAGIHKWLVKVVKYDGSGCGVNWIGVSTETSPRIQKYNNPQYFYGCCGYLRTLKSGTCSLINFLAMSSGLSIEVVLDMDKKICTFNETVMDISPLGNEVYFTLALGALRPNVYEVTKL